MDLGLPLSSCLSKFELNCSVCLSLSSLNFFFSEVILVVEKEILYLSYILIKDLLESHGRCVCVCILRRSLIHLTGKCVFLSCNGRTDPLCSRDS